MRLALFIAFCLSALPLRAEIRPVPYAELAATLGARQDFETLPLRPEPGFNLNQNIRTPGLTIGSHFAGQPLITRQGPPGASHDAPGPGTPPRPLPLRTDAPGQTLPVAFPRGFGSNALLPLGPDGFARLSGRGEGAVALLFDSDQSAFGLRLHTDYAAPLGRARPQGVVTLHIYDRSGKQLARNTLRPGPGITEIGLRTSDDLPRIAGVLVTNLDPGGIALDDILFQVTQRLY
ncbi:hypothetical protein [Shimia aestuarii]|uniref:hypothetical protein n=1 Tax=Shimia aestuarii TaxID=254406 RepID=UPI001FB33E7A|nr:hypothetical protein [Shimia aestuarii]